MKTVKFNFIGQSSSNQANFGEGVTQKKKNNKDMLWSPNTAKAHIGLSTALGGGLGFLEGKKSNMMKGVERGDALRAITGSGWKRKAAGTALGAAGVGGLTYLTHRLSKTSPIGKDTDGRSDKGKKRRR